MPEETTQATKVNADTVICTIGEITFDIAADSKPLMTMGEHSTTEYNSQNINDTTVKNDGKWEPVTLVVTFEQSMYETIKGYWQAAKRDLTYTVSGTGMNGTWTDCSVRVSDAPSIVPGEDGYVTCSITITCHKREKTTTGEA